MKNITLSAEDHLLEKAREKARQEHRSLNDAFRSWLEHWTKNSDRINTYDELMERLTLNAESGGHFSREELNER
ncbi:hypothetical protein MASR2M78_36410 [Treponema sp.]